MAYTDTNFQTKKALKEAVANGRKVEVSQPNPFGGNRLLANQHVYLEGPHYPQPHRWYAQADTDENGYIKPGSVK